MKKRIFYLLLLFTSLLAGCDISDSKNRKGVFSDLFINPLDHILHWIAQNLNNNYGLSIVILVPIIRIVLLPIMINNQKSMAITREKMNIIKPELSSVQEKVKHARTQEEKINANQEMMSLYKKYNINPLKNALGCLPVLIQMPILFGLYVNLKWPSSGGITEYSHFLWFDLTEPNLIVSIIAGILYFIQPLLSLNNMPPEQKQMGYLMAVVSPIMIIWVSLTSASALGLYWSVSAAFLIVQIYFGNKYFNKLAKQEGLKLRNKINNSEKKQTKGVKLIKKK